MNFNSFWTPEIPVIILDLEATCGPDIPERKREIIEIGAVKLINGKKVSQFKIFIKPEANPVLSEYCLNLTHIKQEDVDSGYNLKSALKQFYGWATEGFKTPAIYLSWGPWDKKALLKATQSTGMDYKYKKEVLYNHYDLQAIYSKLFKINSPIGLMKALKRENIEITGNAHRAIDDAKNTVKIYKSQREKIDLKISQKRNTSIKKYFKKKKALKEDSK